MSDTNVPVQSAPPAPPAGPAAAEGPCYSHLMVQHCESTRKWVSFLAILVTALYAIVIVVLLVMLAVGSFAFGGAAFGWTAVGGAAVGNYACGGGAFGEHVVSATRRDPQALEHFGRLRLDGICSPGRRGGRAG